MFRVSYDIGKGISNRFFATLGQVNEFVDGLVAMNVKVGVYPVLACIDGGRWEVLECPRYRQYRRYLCGELMY